MQINSATFEKGVVGSHNVIANKKPQIAFAGRSNVGKSSLINMLVGQKNLVKSSGTPGKTKQINFFLVNKNYYFVDLPGYGYAKIKEKEREKLRKLILWYLISKEAPIAKVVLIIDAKAGLKEFDFEMMDVLKKEEIPFVIAANKIDKLNQKEKHKMIEKIKKDIMKKESEENTKIIPVSAKKGTGRDVLLEEIFVDID